MSVNAFGISKSSESSERRKNASGAAITGAGATAATAGAVGGGIPGANGKFDWDTLVNAHRKNKITGEPNASGKTLWGARAKTGKHVSQGGVFGWRTDAHKKGNSAYIRNEEATRSRTHKNAKTAFAHGRVAGKIKVENEIIPHMGKGKAISAAALVGGLGTTAYGVHRMKSASKKSKISKSKKSDRVSGAAAGVGTAGAAGSIIGHKVFGEQGRKWKTVAEESSAKAEKLVPNLKGVPNKAVYKDPRKIFRGSHRAVIEEAGKQRGMASNARHFSHVYRNAEKGFGHARLPMLALAGAGVTGLALTKDKKKVSKSLGKDMYVSPFGVAHEYISKADIPTEPGYKKARLNSAGPYNVQLRRGTYGKRLKGRLKSGAAGQAVGVAGLGGMVALRKNPKAAMAVEAAALPTSFALTMRGIKRSQNREIKAKDVLITEKKTGKKVTGAGYFKHKVD